MEVFVAAAVIFALAFLGLAISAIRKKHCLGCSCKAADRIISNTGPTREQTCGRELIQIE